MHSNFELNITQDGSSTIRNTQLNVTYHSKFGALQESQHIFIKQGLYYSKASPLHILEIGFGTGLNALLTATQDTSRTIFYTTLETNPLPEAIINQLNFEKTYPQFDQALFETFHRSEWNKGAFVTPQFHFTKIQIEAQSFQSNSLFDVIYFDAFDPETQPELWDISLFKKMHSLLNPNGILVTYCAKGIVKRALTSAGFLVEALPGPPGKREMTRAHKL